MTRCIVIGSEVRAASTAQLLSTSNVPSRAIVQNPDHAKLIADCGKENGLEVVAVFCNDLPKNALAFLRGLREALSQRVKIHALKDGNGQTEPTSRSLHDIGVAEVFCFSNMSPVGAARSIKTRWFPSEEVQKLKPGTRSATTHTGATVVRTSLEAVRSQVPPPVQVAAPIRPSGTAMHQQAEGTAEKKVSPLASVLPIPPFEKLLAVIKRNSVMPLQPQVVNIVGKHGMVLELDPRRIKPLPDNPRWATNPGFAPESLRELGESITLVGQAEAGEVCPILGDPNYDAQLIDGERRLRACKLAEIMFKAGVREDVTADMPPALWALSVVRNNGKEPPTVRELIHIVSRLRSDEFGFTIAQVGTAIGKSVGTVQKLSILGKLHPQVQAMLDESAEEGEAENPGAQRKRQGPRLTSQLALLLAEFSPEEQLEKAEEIVSKGMNYKQARRYVLGERRDAGFRVAGGKKGKQKRWFDALGTLARENLEAFGIYLDMHDKEIAAMMARCTTADRENVAGDLKFLAQRLNDIARKIAPKKG